MTFRGDEDRPSQTSNYATATGQNATPRLTICAGTKRYGAEIVKPALGGGRNDGKQADERMSRQPDL